MNNGVHTFRDNKNQDLRYNGYSDLVQLLEVQYKGYKNLEPGYKQKTPPMLLYGKVINK